ncbi:hypothetical protein [Hydrogenophaga sp.]|uniref:hypothetical protein n=1 Tax=Hydrogenophaga sp. TaxID=1904254 RepID=UPI003561B09B
MSTSLNRLNPFVMMLDPESIINAMEDSLDLRRLRQRICRPLDKPLIPKTVALRGARDTVIDPIAFMDSGCELYAEAQPALQAVH